MWCLNCVPRPGTRARALLQLGSVPGTIYVLYRLPDGRIKAQSNTCAQKPVHKKRTPRRREVSLGKGENLFYV